MSTYWLARNVDGQQGPTRPGADFASFELGRETSRWKGWGGVEAAASTEFPSWQTHSLRLDASAGAVGGVSTDYVPREWDRYEALQFFVFSEGALELEIAVSDGASSASRIASISKGANHVQIRVNDFAGVNLRDIRKLEIMTKPAAATKLYLDRFRLTEYNETLAEFGRMDAPYGDDIATPHFKWANPLASSPIRVMIVPDVSHGRAAIELAQRLEMRLTPISLGSSSGKNRWGFGDFYGERGYSYGAPFTLAYTYLAGALLDGAEYDVMVLPGSRPWDEFPEVVRSAIRRRVEDGMGLVLIDPRVSDPAKAADLKDLSPLWPAADSPPPQRRGRLASLATGRRPLHYAQRTFSFLPLR